MVHWELIGYSTAEPGGIFSVSEPVGEWVRFSYEVVDVWCLFVFEVNALMKRTRCDMHVYGMQAH